MLATGLKVPGPPRSCIWVQRLPPGREKPFLKHYELWGSGISRSYLSSTAGHQPINLIVLSLPHKIVLFLSLHGYTLGAWHVVGAKKNVFVE